MRNSRIEVKPIAGALGAEIYGAKIGDDLDDDAIVEIRQALNEHCVIFFRDQQFDAEQHKAFARRFGEIFVHPNYRGMQEDDEIVMIRREPGDQHIVGEDWHADTTMMEAPPLGAILYALEVPPYGGDTLFANQYLAYDTLSDGMKKMLLGLRAVHTDRLVAGPAANRNAYRATKVRQGDDWRETVNLHPVVRTHPETGRKLLNVNAAYTVGFEGMTEEDRGRCSTTSWRTATGRNSPAASVGGTARSRSGIIARSSIWRSTTLAHTCASCAGCRSPATGRSSDRVRELPVRPSGLRCAKHLRMRAFLNAITGSPHPEKRREARLEGRTKPMPRVPG
jgi:taurine dioxygenase